MNAHRQAIESAWENLLEAIAVAAQEARAKQPGKPPVNKDIAPKLDTLLAALRGLSNAWTGIRDLLPTEPIEDADISDVQGASPESAYWKPLAKALLSLGGGAPARDAIAAVGKAMETQLQQIDRDLLPSGAVRWINRTQFARERLKKHGLISRSTPRGHWKLTETGERWTASDMQTLPQPVEEPDPRQPPLPF